MTNPITLQDVDRDGALQETAAAVAADSRTGFLRKAALFGGTLAGGSLLAAGLAKPARAQTARDVAILNFALTLEYLEASFYTEAVAMGALSGDLLRFARVVRDHENAHVRFLRGALGRAAVAKPRFNFRGTTEDEARFTATAITLEDTGVMAYAGQAPRLQTDSVLAAALSIHSVEARHAAWIRHLARQPPAPRAFDRPRTMGQVLAAVRGTRFIVQARPAGGGTAGGGTTGGARPQFTG